MTDIANYIAVGASMMSLLVVMLGLVVPAMEVRVRH